MCGIVGFSLERPDTGSARRINTALDLLRPRGPDDAGLAFGGAGDHAHLLIQADVDQGVWKPISNRAFGAAAIGLGHTRFSIVDLSRRGAQPMLSPDGSVCLTFNGEIYNHEDLRTELKAKGHVFRSRSDTEVLLRAYLQWGEGCFERLSGWWAVAISDLNRSGVLLCRDRLGKAPLYVFRAGGQVIWASEIQALLHCLGRGEAAPNWDAIDAFVGHGLRDLYGRTSYDDITTLPAGSYSWVRQGKLDDAVSFWRLPTQRLSEKDISPEEAAVRVKETLVQATALRLNADVPVALQLSGGLDSSAILACVAELGKPLHAITASFREQSANEDAFARAAVAGSRAEVEHQIVNMDSGVSPAELSDFTASIGEPFHSPAQIVNRKIWTILRSLDIKVVLYGAGGDEVFAGYYAQYFVPFLRSRIASGDVKGFLSNWLNLSEREPSALDLLGRLGMLAPGLPQLFRSAQQYLPRSRRIYTRAAPPPHFSEDFRCKMLEMMGDRRMNYWLRIDNQNSMQVPIEVRSPFLDHRVVETAFGLPETYLVRDGWMKWIVRKAFEKDLPEAVVWRRVKMGFPFPLSNWLSDNASAIRALFQAADAPYISRAGVDQHLEQNIRSAPETTWRALSYALWYAGRPASSGRGRASNGDRDGHVQRSDASFA